MSEVESVSLVDRRGYLTVVVGIEGQDNMLVRRPEEVREWFNLLQRMVKESKARVMKSTEQFWSKSSETDSKKMEDWVAARARVGARYQYTQDRPASTYSVDRGKQNRRTQSECELIILL